MSDCHSNDGDAQAIYGANGPGPFLIENNRLEGSGENVMFGGGDSRAPELLPSDITVRRNRVTRSGSGIQVAGSPAGDNVRESTRRVLVEQNLIDPVPAAGTNGAGHVFATGSYNAPAGVAFRRNTAWGTNAAMLFYEGVTPGFVYTDNLVNGGEYAWGYSSSVGQGTGVTALNYHAPGWVTGRDCFVGVTEASSTPADLRVSDASQCPATAGVDRAQLEARLAGGGGAP